MRGYFYKENNGDYTVFDFDNLQPVQTLGTTSILTVITVVFAAIVIFICKLLGF